ncbi:MAG: sodium:solute symporter [Planctomycetes bacterium]|nr:sodium:solute symporter [Planctomycetota bacterium]
MKAKWYIGVLLFGLTLAGGADAQEGPPWFERDVWVAGDPEPWPQGRCLAGRGSTELWIVGGASESAAAAMASGRPLSSKLRRLGPAGAVTTPLDFERAFGAVLPGEQGLWWAGGLVRGEDGRLRGTDRSLLIHERGPSQLAVTEGPRLPFACVDAVLARSAAAQVWFLGRELGQDDWRLFARLKDTWDERLLPADFEAGSSNLGLVIQHDGFGEKLFLAAKGRLWKGNLEGPSQWRDLTPLPRPLTRVAVGRLGPAHLFLEGPTAGGSRQALMYHVLTDTWVELGDLGPSLAPLAPSCILADGLVIVGDEPGSVAWKLARRTPGLGSFDGVVIVVYLVFVLGLGLLMSGRSRSLDAYFRGDGRIPWWAAGCSIFATMVSSITFMAIPAKAYAQDWLYAPGGLLTLAVTPIVVLFAMPVYRRLGGASAYEYFERRFSRSIRRFASGSFCLFQVFRMGLVLALAALALASVTAIDARSGVFVMGLLAAVYCTTGGIRAVIWTDTLQAVLLVGAALLCLVLAIDGAGAGWLADAAAAGKTRIVSIDFAADSFSRLALWVVIVGGVGQNLAIYTADQSVIQRYLTTTDERAASRAIWTNGWMAIPTVVVFYGLGTAFWAFYRGHPERLDPSMTADRVLPHFVVHELPLGIAGLVIAGMLAAAQSTVSSSMNSGATAVVSDFFGKRAQGVGGARWATMGFAALGTLAGASFVNPDIRSRFDAFLEILGLFLGVLAGLFFLGVLTRRAHAGGALCGAMTALGVVSLHYLGRRGIEPFGLALPAWTRWPVTGYLYATIGISLSFSVGYLASLVIPRASPERDGSVGGDSDMVSPP